MADSPSTLTAWRVGGQIDPAWLIDVSGLVGRGWDNIRAVATLSAPADGAPVVDPTNGAHVYPLTITNTLPRDPDTGATSDGQWITADLKAVTAANSDDALQPSGLTWRISVGVDLLTGAGERWSEVYAYTVQVDADRDYVAEGETITVAGVECIDINALLDSPITVPESVTFAARVLAVVADNPTTNYQARRAYPHLKTSAGAVNAAILSDISAGRLVAGDVVQTLSYWESSQIGGGAYRVVAAGTGTDDGGAYVTAGSLQLEAIFRDAVHLAQFGPLVGTQTTDASTANQAAFTAAINAAVVRGFENIVLPPGVLWMKADNGTAAGSGLRVVVPDGKTVRFIGQAGAVIKRLALTPPIALVATSSLVFMTANTGITVEWHHVTFDGNEANCEFDDTNSTTLYAEEQSANIKWLSGSGTPLALRFFYCDVGKGRVGDGYHANVTVENFMAADCSTVDASVRRVRSDWQMSRYATYATVMSNITCNSFESEPALTATTARLIMSNVYAASVFDLAGDTSGTTHNPIRAHLTNVRCDTLAGRAGLPFCNFWLVNGDAVNCHFTGIDRIQRCKLHFIGGTITVLERSATPGLADAVQIWHDQASESLTSSSYPGLATCYVVFDRVRFLAESGVTTGEYVTTSTVAKVANMAGAAMVRTAIIDCETPTPLDYVISSSRGGIIEVRRGDLRGNTAITQYSNDADHYLQLIAEPQMGWYAPAIVHIPSGISVTGSGVSELVFAGEFNGEAMVPIDAAAVVSSPTVRWFSSATMHVDSNPHGRIVAVPGLTAKLGKPVNGGVVTWRPFIPSGHTESGYSTNQWRPLDWATNKGATASRPTLASTDWGVMYMDTTLDADGKPIWWNGSAWVDATGTTV